MTDIFKSPEKLSNKQRLFDIAVETLQRDGWEVERAFGSGKGSVRRIRKGEEDHLVSIRTSQDQYIAFPRNDKDNGWGTLDDVDVVIPVSVNDPKHPTAAWVHWIDATEMRARFDRAYKARREAHHKLHPGRGHWLALYVAEDRTVPSLVGAGVGLDHPGSRRQRRTDRESRAMLVPMSAG